VGIAFDRSKAKDLVDLFEWNETELKELEQLTGAGGRDSILEKKYKHIVMMVEIAYGIAIVPRDSISSNPGCEWQLRYYGSSS